MTKNLVVASGISADPDGDSIPAIDTAAYLFQITRELAAMADAQGFSRVAAALELSRSLAAEALATLTVSRQVRNAAPEDAA